MLIIVVTFVLILLVVVGLHEAGHALAARYYGVKIKRIAIGFGKPIFQGNKWGCEWVWGLLPLGGYVHFLNTRIEPVDKMDYPYAFDKQTYGKRIIILLAGGISNFLVSLVLLSIFFLMGFKETPAQIAEVMPHSVASQAGIEKGMRIQGIGTYETNSWQEAGMGFLIHWGKAHVPLQIISPTGQSQTLYLDLDKTPRLNEKNFLLTLGLKPALKQHYVTGVSLGQALAQAVKHVFFLLYFFLAMIKQLIMGAIPFSALLGPIGLLKVSIHSLMQGIALFCYFLASLSLVVGLVNLLPLPTLDGGSIMYTLIEAYRGKPVSVAWEILLHRLVIIMLSVVLIQLLLNDIQRL